MDSIEKEDERDRQDREVEALEAIAKKLESIDRKLSDLCESLKRVKPVPIGSRELSDLMARRDYGDYDAELFQELRALRTQIASRRGVPPYVVFSDRTLQDMVRAKPRSLDAMLQVKRVGEAKLKKYGSEFLSAIQEHFHAQGNRAPADNAPDKAYDAPDTQTAKNARRKAVADKAYDVASIRCELPNAYKPWYEKDDVELRQLYEQGKSVSELSKRFGRGQGAIRSRLVKIGLIDAAN